MRWRPHDPHWIHLDTEMRFVNYLDQKCAVSDPSKFEFTNFTQLTWGRSNRFLGVVLGNEALVLDYTTMLSFRIKLTNLPSVPGPLWMMQAKPTLYPYTYEYVSDYFAANNDNPYALWTYLICVSRPSPPITVPQYPPLNRRKHTGKIWRRFETNVRPVT
jgi:hypothetical protein